MACEDLIILIPSHSLEDFPTELGDPEAASLLNAFSASWHPQLIGATKVLPRWHRCIEPPEMVRGKLVVIPEASRSQLPEGWSERATESGADVVFAGEDRPVLIQSLLEKIGGARSDLDPELVSDAIALGTCHLLSELLMRSMRQYSILDEGRLQREGVAAASAILANDPEAARTRIRNCFDVLTESRERFYPTECHLIDLCLVIPDYADEKLVRMLQTLKPTNLLLQACDLERIAGEKPEILKELKEAWERNTASMIGGEYHEVPNSCRSLTHLLREFETGRELFQKYLNKSPEVWGRRKFGLVPQLPQLLKHFGYHGALHLAMDDGLYPDEEHSKIRWSGAGGAYLDAMTRIPLAAESASSYLRFPSRMSESMDHDQVAAVLFARWPEVHAPWFDDMRRMQNYSTPLGRWTTLEDFFCYTDTAGRLSSYDVGDYLSPEMLHAVARRETLPIQRHVLVSSGRRILESARYCLQIGTLIRQGKLETVPLVNEELQLDQISDSPNLIQFLEDQSLSAAQSLSALLLKPDDTAPAGFLLINPLSFERKLFVDFSAASSTGEIIPQAMVQVPGSGFAWISSESLSPNMDPEPQSVPLAEGTTLRNGQFEIELHDRTGGIASLKKPGRAPNRLSLQLAYRFQQERELPVVEPQTKPTKSWYSRMELRGTKVISSGPLVGEIETHGEIVDQVSNRAMAEFRIRYRVVKGLPYLTIDLELETEHVPEGDPWSNYYALRWAWNDSTAVLTRSQVSQPQSFRMQRFEAPEFMEIASESDRTTLLFGGLSFHRKTDDRILDTILIVEGETTRRFRLGVAFDQPYPLKASSDYFTPPIMVPTSGHLPAFGSQGWFFHIDVKSVQILSIGPVPSQRTESSTSGSSPTANRCCCLLISETEGRTARASIRSFLTPSRARKTDANGATIVDLPIEGDAILVHLSAFETTLIELQF